MISASCLVRIGLWGLCLLIVPLPGQAQPIDESYAPELSVTIDPPESLSRGGYLDGQIAVQVRLLSRYPYETLNLILPEFDGADQVQLLRPSNRQVETFGGTRYVFETAFALFPTRTGPLNLPPVRAEGVVGLGAGSRDVAFSVQSDGHMIDIAGPDSRYDDPWWLVADDIEITETWSQPTDSLRAGDIVQRDIQVVARGTTPERLPRLEHGWTQGVTATQIDQTFETETTVEGVLTTLRQSWALKFEPQVVTFIPPIGIDYWDQRARVQRKANVPGQRLELLPADSAAIARTLMAEAAAENRRFKLLGGTVLALLALPFLVTGGILLAAAVPTRADLRLAKLLRRDKSGDLPPEKLYPAFTAWADASQIDLATPAAQSPPQQAMETVNTAVFGPGAHAAMRLNARELTRFARKNRLARRCQQLKALFDRTLAR